jgi:hypothetical protein
MACPLLDMEKTYQEFTQWLNEEPSRRDEVDIKNIESGFKKALLKLSKILPYEEQLVIAYISVVQLRKCSTASD